MKRLILKFNDLHPVSVNDAYIPTSGRLKKGNTRRSAFLRRSPELLKFQDDFSKELEKHDSKIKEFLSKCEGSFEYLGFEITILFGLPRDSFFYKRKSISDDVRPHDTSNYIKTVEDTLFRYMDINDKYNIVVKSAKYYDDSLEEWGFYVILKPINYMKYDKKYIKEVYLNA